MDKARTDIRKHSDLRAYPDASGQCISERQLVIFIPNRMTAEKTHSPGDLSESQTFTVYIHSIKGQNHSRDSFSRFLPENERELFIIVAL